MSQRPFEQTPGIKNGGNESCISPASGYEELSRSMECITLQCSVEDLQNESLEEQKSFYQLDPIPVTMDETSSEQLVKETASSEKLPLKAFDKKKLPEKSIHVDEGNKAMELHSQCNMDIKEPDQSFPEGQESLRVPRETNLEDSDICLHSVVQQNNSLFQRHGKHSHPMPRSSCHIPVWVSRTDFQKQGFVIAQSYFRPLISESLANIDFTILFPVSWSFALLLLPDPSTEIINSSLTELSSHNGWRSCSIPTASPSLSTK